MTLAIALLVAASVAVTGWRLAWLTPPAAVAATGVGSAVLWGGGWRGLILLGTFFASGNLLSRRAGPPRRTVLQVVANGWTAMAGALLIREAPGLGWALLAGGLAAAQADTWATEIGGRARTMPVLLTTGRRVPAGTSGGVTWLGTAGGVAGATVIGTLSWWLLPLSNHAVAIVAAGITGMLVDSLLGATVQARFSCPRCDAMIETPYHEQCAVAAVSRGGLPWMTNDTVNMLGSGVGAALAVAARAVG